MAMVFKINDGTVAEPIVNARGVKIGEVIYNPHDMGILDRYNLKQAEMQEIGDRLKSLQTDNISDVMTAVRTEFEPLLDYIVAPGFYEGTFSRIYPLTILPETGEMFCIAVLREVLDKVKETLNVDLKESAARKKKYLEGYNE